MRKSEKNVISRGSFLLRAKQSFKIEENFQATINSTLLCRIFSLVLFL